MTEAEWLSTTTKPGGMWRSVRAMSPRKTQLVACAICRLFPARLMQTEWLVALDAAERNAEQTIPPDEFRRLIQPVCDQREAVLLNLPRDNDDFADHATHAIALSCQLLEGSDEKAIPLRFSVFGTILFQCGLAAARIEPKGLRKEIIRRECEVLREVVAFPVMNYRSFANGDHVEIAIHGHPKIRVSAESHAIASVIETEQAFDRLPILADAMEDAGCTDERFLNHLREPREHCRGCWALDLVLGRS